MMAGPGPWVPVLVLLGVFTLAVLREPRRLWPGIVLLVAVEYTGMLTLGEVLDVAWRWGGETTAALTLLGVLLLAVLTIGVLGVFLVANAVVMIRKEGRGPAALAALALGAGVVGYLVFGFAALSSESFALAAWTILIGLPLAYLGQVFTAFVGYAVLYGWAARWGGPVDAVVVLGAGLGRGDRVTPLLASRLDRGLRVYERSRAAGRPTVIIVSGGQGADERISEAEAMRRHLLAQGVDPAHVHREDQSTTTQENLERSAVVLRELGLAGRTAVVTSNYHAFRAATLMRHAGITGYSVGAPTARYFWPSATVREYVALLRDHVWLNLAVLAVLCLPAIARVIAALSDLRP